jgi:hypothetical protein
MAGPWDDLADALAPGPGDPAVNVYPAFAEAGMMAPAIVLQPDEPWIEPQAFGFDQERYVALAAVPAAAGRRAGVRDLYDLVAYIIARASTIDGVAYESVTAPRIDDSTGTPYLAAAVRLTYRNCIEPS